MLTSTVTFRVPEIPAGTLITLLTPVALLSGMFLGTSVEVKSGVTGLGPPHSGGTALGGAHVDAEDAAAPVQHSGFARRETHAEHDELLDGRGPHTAHANHTVAHVPQR